MRTSRARASTLFSGASPDWRHGGWLQVTNGRRAGRRHWLSATNAFRDGPACCRAPVVFPSGMKKPHAAELAGTGRAKALIGCVGIFFTPCIFFFRRAVRPLPPVGRPKPEGAAFWSQTLPGSLDCLLKRPTLAACHFRTLPPDENFSQPLPDFLRPHE